MRPPWRWRASSRARDVQVACGRAAHGVYGCPPGRRAGDLLGNFTWDWIYEDFTAEHPDFRPCRRALGRRYAEAEAAWRLPMHGGFATVRTVLDFPWIARRSRRDPRESGA